MNAEELEKIVARHELQCNKPKESFNVEYGEAISQIPESGK